MICRGINCSNKARTQKLGLCIRCEAISKNIFCACGRPAFSFKTRECHEHYYERIHRNRKRKCKKCWTPAVVKGYCRKHYIQQRTVINFPCPDCILDQEKPKPGIKKGYCDKHYRRRQRSGEWETQICSTTNCKNTIYTKESELCSSCYEKKRTGEGISDASCIACDEPLHARSLCLRHYHMFMKETHADEPLRASYVVPSRVRVKIADMIHFAYLNNGMDFDLWLHTVYRNKPEDSAQRQWSRIRHQLDYLGIPYREEVGFNNKVRLKFDVCSWQLEEYFEGKHITSEKRTEMGMGEDISHHEETIERDGDISQHQE